MVKSRLKKILQSSLLLRGDGIIQVESNGFWKYRSPPTKSLKKAAALFQQIGGEVVIEIGTGIHGDMAGNSILVWARETRAKKIIAIDLDPEQIEDAKSKTKVYSNVHLVIDDGIDYLSKCDLKIDLLYLDYWVSDPAGAVPGTGRAESYRAAYAAARYKMNDKSIILIDDTDHVHPWKHTYIVPDARKDGYVVLYTGRQTLMMR